ncbi:hypothetical protein [Jeotgalibacillus soli]|uniref:Resolvase HTH domain-containing protein n=1 Tax=Jeotgalibacillus soli TaxID=889306 RepID=A0A0C2RRM7_9BACL|nr:hypothetical protein [Jeotgalibacillus soli]KIL44404.1 hypothetical protein KP78_33680 [Jeotgalibacillus soli]
MELTAMIVAGIAVLLFIFSFFLKDRTKKTEEELEELSMNLYQEMYQLKKRIRILEEEMMVDTKLVVSKTSSMKQRTNISKPINEIILNQVLALHKQGLPLDQIVRLSSLSKEEVQTIIQTRS